jgi:Uma2 family endonuclease
MSTTSHLLTADDLWRMQTGERHELVKGELRTVAPSGFDHGAVMFNLGRRLANYVAEHKLGVVVGGETGFRLMKEPDTVRGADVAFVAASRIPASGRPATYFEGAPDLAVEILSPGDTVAELEEKVDDYLAAGARAVWVVNPRRRSVTIYRPRENPTVLRDDASVTAEDIVPGFSCRVADVFD